MKNYTVSELSKCIKSIVEGSFPDTVAVTGEVSNFSKASSGHVYFVLKDGTAQISVAFFRQYAAFAGAFIPKNGDKVQVVGDVKIYEAGGSYQIIAKRVLYDSAGDFWRKYEETKRCLEAEGLFDAARKRQLPVYPVRVALITSPSGAAIKDFIAAVNRTGAKFAMEVWGVPVQGADAAKKIVSAINAAGALINRYDVVVIMRGGGSLEDLAVFNDEAVVRAAAKSAVPTISAVGHERDFTVIDFAADCRSATPTAAAVLLSEGYVKSFELAMYLHERLIDITEGKVQQLYQRLDYTERLLSGSSPVAMVKSYANCIIMADKSLKFLVVERLAALKSRLTELSLSVEKKSPASFIAAAEVRLSGFERTLKNIILADISSYKHKLETLQEKMKVLNPDNILNRGYALVLKNGSVITSVNDVGLKEDIEIKMKDGYINSFVVSKKLEVANGQNTDNS